MLDTEKPKDSVTSYQADWDERLKKHKRFSRIGNYGFSALYLAATAVFGVSIFSKFSVMAASADVAAKSAATAEAGALVVGFFVVVLLLGMVSVPFMRAVSWSEWALGERPSDDFKPREAKPIDLSIEQVNEDVRYFHVSGLYRHENYTFKVERLTDKNAFRQPEYSYRISEKDNKIGLHYTMDSSCFKGMTDDEITENLIQTISFQLEEKTDHFKELNYAI